MKFLKLALISILSGFVLSPPQEGLQRELSSSSRVKKKSTDDEIFNELKELADEARVEDQKKARQKKIVKIYPADNYDQELEIEKKFERDQARKEAVWRKEQQRRYELKKARLKALEDEKESRKDLERERLQAQKEKRRLEEARWEREREEEAAFVPTNTFVPVEENVNNFKASESYVYLESEREARRSVVSAEAFGRGLRYSVNFDYLFLPNIAAGVGIGYHSISAEPYYYYDEDLKIESFMVPVYGNYYFNFLSDSRHKVFGTGGVTVLHMTSSADYEDPYEMEEAIKGEFPVDLRIDYSGTYTFPTIGVGYEFRGYNGILARVAAYGIYSSETLDEKLYFFGGLSAGFAF